ncbi:MAG: metallophosphoesterase family protein [Eubacteriales bacterium]|nr:metallophosphoesterase family protein [Eubacteriales bacterium]
MRRNKKLAKIIATATIVTTVMATAVTAYGSAAPDGSTKAETTAAAANGVYDAWKSTWSTLSTDWTQVSMTPGSSEAEMNFAWYSTDGKDTAFKYGKMADLSDAVQVQINQSAAQTGYKSNKVSLKNLEAGTTYYYQVEGKSIESFTTGDASDFSFIFVGDPQIGSSNSEKAKKPEDIAKPSFAKAQYEAVLSDSFNWANTLNQAYTKTNGKASFVLSAGDQIQTNAKKVQSTTVSEMEYSGYLSPSLLKKLPVATTVGNHDADNANYLYHFNIPNMSDLGSNSIVGGDYSFTYGNALFIMLNTQDTNVAEHKEFIKNAKMANQDCKWTIVTLHQDIYGSAEHSNEPEIVNLRYSLVPIFEEYGVDVVLTGHDHAYTRSQLLTDGGVKKITYTDDEYDEQFDKDIDAGENPASVYVSPANIKTDTTDTAEQTYLEYLNSIMDKEAVNALTKDQSVAVNPDGILYMTAGSSSGSKYYDLVARKQEYVAARWQEDVPTYSVIDMDETSFTINTYRTDTNEAIDSSFTIVKSADKAALSDEIARLEALNLSSDAYTEESWNIYQAALEGAKQVVNRAEATTKEMENALTALKTAYQSLTAVAAESQTETSNEDVQTADAANPWAYALTGGLCLILAGGSAVVKRRKLQ